MYSIRYRIDKEVKTNQICGGPQKDRSGVLLNSIRLNVVEVNIWVHNMM